MEKKMTKKEMFKMIKKEMADRQEIVDFCNHEIELLDKKKGSVNEKKLAEREVEVLRKAGYSNGIKPSKL